MVYIYREIASSAETKEISLGINTIRDPAIITGLFR
jgi:hypothetical protein